MSELVEIVARHMCEWAGYTPDEKLQGDNLPSLGWMTFRKDARDFLRAIEGAGYKVVGRFPTDKMITAMNDTGHGSVWASLEIYKAAFDAAPTVGGGDA